VVRGATGSHDGNVDRRYEREVDAAAAAFDGAGDEEQRLRLELPPGRSSASSIRPALAELVADADPVVIEQIAVLVGALTSGSEHAEPSAPFEVEICTDPAVIAVKLRDDDRARSSSAGGFLEPDGSLVTGWRLRLVQRLADRWSLVIEDGLTLEFEFDVESAGSPNAMKLAAARRRASSPSGPG
jgi:hypothetical protein